jgi:hypothetical protein
VTIGIVLFVSAFDPLFNPTADVAMRRMSTSHLKEAFRSFSRFSAQRPELVQTCAGAFTWYANEVSAISKRKRSAIAGCARLLLRQDCMTFIRVLVDFRKQRLSVKFILQDARKCGYTEWSEKTGAQK